MDELDKNIQQRLRAPFAAKDVDWRLQNTDKAKLRGIAVAYIDSRAVQNRLDEVFGIYGWQNAFAPWHPQKKGAAQTEAQICGISVYDKASGRWITKWDGAEDTEIEPIKGGLSDSFKRAGVQWGIGRYLYDLPATWVEAVPAGNSYRIADKELKRLADLHDKYVEEKFGRRAAPQPEKAPAPQSAPAAPQSKKPPLRTAPPAAAYKVLQAVRQELDGKRHTVVELSQKEDGESLRAYYQGWDDRLKAGAVLCQVQTKTLSGKKSKSNYIVLTGFELAA